MIAGGLGVIDSELTKKIEFPAGTLLIQLGGPGMRIGMGGGAASSMATGANAAELDFDSVQRGNPEIERRAQEVINHCWRRARPTPSWPSTTWAPAASPMPSRADQRCRPRRALRPAQGAAEESGLAPKEIWCNEARSATCWPSRPSRWSSSRPSASASAAPSPWSAWPPKSASWCWRTAVEPAASPVDMPMDVLLGKPPKMHRDVKRGAPVQAWT
jgi:phosphoribosylformylglycinamidine synthase